MLVNVSNHAVWRAAISTGLPRIFVSVWQILAFELFNPRIDDSPKATYGLYVYSYQNQHFSSALTKIKDKHTLPIITSFVPLYWFSLGNFSFGKYLLKYIIKTLKQDNSEVAHRCSIEYRLRKMLWIFVHWSPVSFAEKNSIADALL